MSKVDEMLKVTQLRELKLDLGKSARKEGNDALFFKVYSEDGAIWISDYQSGPPRLYISKEHALPIANWLMENYGEGER